MSNIENVILYIVASFMQGSTFWIYMREMLGVKKNKYYYPLLWVVMEIIAVMFIQPLKSVLANLLWSISWFFMIGVIFTKGSVKKKFLLIFIYYMVTMISEPLWTIIMIRLGLSDGVLQDDRLISIVYIMGQLVVLLILMLIRTFYKKKIYNSSWNKNGLGVAVVSGSSLIIGAGYISMMYKYNDSSLMGLIITVLIITINFVCYYFFVVGEDKKRLEIEYTVYEEQIKLYDQWIEEQKVMHRTLEAFRHDMKYHILALRGICNRDNDEKAEPVEEIDEYLSNIGMNYNIMKSEVDSGNALMDAILNMKINYALSIGITIDKKIKVPSELRYNGMDLVIVLGNLLDNAIEGAEGNREEKKLSIELKFDVGNLAIYIENTYNGYLDGKKGNTEDIMLLKTTKKNKGFHGIGMKNVADVVKKYDGTVNWSASDGVFAINILLYEIER